jgi:hypothetical protein
VVVLPVLFVLLVLLQLVGQFGVQLGVQLVLLVLLAVPFVVVLIAINRFVGEGTTVARIFSFAVSGVIQSLKSNPPVLPEF